MSVAAVDIAIIGAGPYGLSLAARLRGSGRSVRIFGAPMQFWSKHMPQGMRLKSEGFASNLYDSESKFTLKVYCAERNIPYADIGLPVPIETFIAYGLEFQQRLVPELEKVLVTSLVPCAGGFELTTETGEVARARQVVVATGIMNFAHIPPQLWGLPDTMVTHSSQHSDLSGFKGRRVAVMGAGASAVDLAALLHQVGSDVELIARRPGIVFQDPPKEPRSFFARLKAPRSGLGLGWRSRMCTDIPTVFHAMPQPLRIRAVRRHLGPAPCWFVRDAVVGRVPMHLGATLIGAQVERGRLRIAYSQQDQPAGHIEVDHLIAATGYQVAVSRLAFLDESIKSRMRKVTDTPVVDRYFESSVPGLYFIGAATANSFGPLLRFAYGADFATTQVAKRLIRSS